MNVGSKVPKFQLLCMYYRHNLGGGGGGGGGEGGGRGRKLECFGGELPPASMQLP